MRRPPCRCSSSPKSSRPVFCKHENVEFNAMSSVCVCVSRSQSCHVIPSLLNPPWDKHNCVGCGCCDQVGSRFGLQRQLTSERQWQYEVYQQLTAGGKTRQQEQQVKENTTLGPARLAVRSLKYAFQSLSSSCPCVLKHLHPVLPDPAQWHASLDWVWERIQASQPTPDT